MKSSPSLREISEKLAARIHELKTVSSRTAFSVGSGEHSLKKAGHGETFWQFREYQSGDMPRSIDWRQSGKADRIYVREKEQHKTKNYFFWLKQGDGMDFRSSTKYPSKKNSADILALTLALLHSRDGEMIAYAGHQKTGHSEKTLQTFEHLLLKRRNEPFLPPSLSNLPKHSSLYLLADFLEPVEELEQKIMALSPFQCRGFLIQVLDPAEIIFPYKGRILFTHVTDERAKHLIENASDISSSYQQRLQSHIEDIKNLCSKIGWHYALHRTDADPFNVLSDVYSHSAFFGEAF